MTLISQACSNLLDPVPVVTSPDQNTVISLEIKEGRPYYKVDRNNESIIELSPLGMVLSDSTDMLKNVEITSISSSAHNEAWEPVYGTDAEIADVYNEMAVVLTETTENPRTLTIRFRAYNDGIGFRYEWPKQDHLDSLIILDEKTRFNLTGDHEAWWIVGDYDSYEKLYNHTRISEVVGHEINNQYTGLQHENPNLVNTPVTMKTDNGFYLSFHEANLTDYAGMTLQVSAGDKPSLKSSLVPWKDGTAVKADLPHQSPWRTIHIVKEAADLVDSHLIQNFNEPSKIEDTSWIKPMKYVGIWWGLHLGKETWAAGPIHGATTENTKAYIDFAKANNIQGVLVEGWNPDWDKWGEEDAFSFTEAYPDYDLEYLAKYAKDNGIELIAHHETGGDAISYEKQLEDAFKQMNRLGQHALKTGYAGGIRPVGEHHHGQFMVNHYRKVVEMGVKYQVAIDAHEPIKPTGISRTYPNMMTREGVRGQEYNAWSEGNPASHMVTLPFTRALGGPIDYTPAVFDVLYNQYKKDNRVHTTLAHQLSLFVILYSPLQMAADIIENYEGHPAFEFIRQCGVDWQESHTIHAAIGEYITIARKEKGSDNWFIGSATDQNARELELTLDFLDADKSYTAYVYKDAADANWETNPMSYDIEEVEVKKGDVLPLKLAAGGGQAIAIMAK